MALRSEDSLQKKRYGIIKASQGFLEVYQEYVPGKMSSFVPFNFKMWKESIEQLAEVNPEISKKLHQLLVAGVSDIRSIPSNFESKINNRPNDIITNETYKSSVLGNYVH